MNPRVKEVKYESPYRMIITFTNNEIREFDISFYLQYPVYEVLKDGSFCSKAIVFNGTIIWNDTVDFDPDTLYMESRPIVIV